jgi:cytoskeletal protein CcmA (bactofilin family)
MLTALWKRAETPSEDVSERDISLLARGLKIRGTLDTTGEVHIFGHVTGRINAGRLELGRGGYVEGDIVAKEVLLCGRLKGRVFALDVTIAPGAILEGRVFHHTISVAKEAQIEGRMPWRPLNFFETLTDLPKET